jgi:hypothetical protein
MSAKLSRFDARQVSFRDANRVPGVTAAARGPGVTPTPSALATAAISLSPAGLPASITVEPLRLGIRSVIGFPAQLRQNAEQLAPFGKMRARQPISSGVFWPQVVGDKFQTRGLRFIRQ